MSELQAWGYPAARTTVRSTLVNTHRSNTMSNKTTKLKGAKMNKQRVRDVMTNLVVMIYPQDPIEEAASRLVRNGISGAPVVKDGKVVGVISEADIARALIGPASTDRGLQTADVLSLIMRNASASEESSHTAANVMSSQVFTIGPDENLFKAARLLDRHGIKRLSVVDGEGYLMGILARGDLIRAMTRYIPTSKGMSSKPS